MDIAIDLTAAFFLLLFFYVGWRKGLLLASLGVARVVIASTAALLAGRYIGYWLGEVANRPRIVMIPMVAALTFAIITFAFHVAMCNIRARHQVQAEKHNIKLPLLSRLGGGGVNLAVGLLTLMLVLWMGDVLAVGLTGKTIPGTDESRLAIFTRRAVYETTYALVPKTGKESQVATMARMISNPAEGLQRLQNVLEAESIQGLAADPGFAQALLSGSPEVLSQNAAMQQLVQDKATLRELREMGILSASENEAALYEKLSIFGKNETIRISFSKLKEKDLLSADKITLLLRDPDFDVIIGELAK